MTPLSAEPIRDAAILVARILLVLLFVVFGWSKLTNYSARSEERRVGKECRP